jgi:hypothetical protein
MINEASLGGQARTSIGIFSRRELRRSWVHPKQHWNTLALTGMRPSWVEVTRVHCFGHLNFSSNSVIAVLPGPLGTSDGGWASEFRGVGPKPPQHLDMEETVSPIEENGFLLADFTPEIITLRYSQPITDIDTLEPFHTTELRRT